MRLAYIHTHEILSNQKPSPYPGCSMISLLAYSDMAIVASSSDSRSSNGPSPHKHTRIHDSRIHPPNMRNMEMPEVGKWSQGTETISYTYSMSGCYRSPIDMHFDPGQPLGRYVC